MHDFLSMHGSVLTSDEDKKKDQSKSCLYLSNAILESAYNVHDDKS